jgi:hypothetical protein
MPAMPGPLDEPYNLAAPSRARFKSTLEEAAVSCPSPFVYDIVVFHQWYKFPASSTIKQNSSLGNRPLDPFQRKKKIRLKDSREVKL